MNLTKLAMVAAATGVNLGGELFESNTPTRKEIDEYELIKAKKSKLSANQRARIVAKVEQAQKRGEV